MNERMALVKRVVKESLLPSVQEDDSAETESERETLGGIGSRPPSRPRKPYSRGSVDHQQTVTRADPQYRGLGERAPDGGQSETEEEEGEGSTGTDSGVVQESGRECVIPDEDYDTDLELDEVGQPYDPTGQSRYREMCKSLNVIPVSCVLRNMQSSTLVLKHHGLGPLGTKALAVSLVTNTSILRLNLRDNWMEDLGGAAIADMLKENCYITDVDLSENRLGERGARALSAMLLENTTLASLNIARNELTDRAATHLARALTANQNLQNLDLSHNRLGEASGDILGTAIAENVGLKSLNLAWNCIRGRGAIALTKGIGANIFLRALDLSYNGLGKDGAIALGESLRANNTLEELNISNNRIPPEGAIHFSMGLRVNKTIRTLKMCRNPMQYTGCYAILKSVEANPESALESLDFSDITVSQEFDDLFSTVKDTLPNLEVKHGGRIDKFRQPTS